MDLARQIILLLSFIAIFFANGCSSSRSEEYELNDAEYESLSEFVDAIRDHEDFDKETDDDMAELDPAFDNDLANLVHSYDKYTYERIPEDSLQRRIGKAYQKVLEEPCEETDDQDESEQKHPHTHVGSLPGRPGVDYPNYEEIPLTSFSCAGRHTPGFYADLETNCQVFHVCYPHRRESFLCPIGTTFNQPILACDYWYNGNCSSAPDHYDVDEEVPVEVDEAIEDLISSVMEEMTPEDVTVEQTEAPVSFDVPEITSKPVKVLPVEPEVIREIVPQVKTVPVPKFIKFLPVKATVAKLAVPEAASVVKAKVLPLKTLKAKTAVPVAKVVKTKVVIPAVKAKVVAAKAVPVAKLVKASVPAVKKAVAANILLAKKAKLLKPLVLKKAIAADKALLAKAKAAKLAAVPVASVMTKKHLTSAMLKVLKAHKLQALRNAAYHSASYY